MKLVWYILSMILVTIAVTIIGANKYYNPGADFVLVKGLLSWFFFWVTIEIHHSASNNWKQK